MLSSQDPLAQPRGGFLFSFTFFFFREWWVLKITSLKNNINHERERSGTLFFPLDSAQGNFSPSLGLLRAGVEQSSGNAHLGELILPPP